MSILVVGLSHRTAPVSLLEQVALGGPAAAALAAETAGSPHVAEAAVLSTCNRVEVYADVDKFHGGVVDVTERLSGSTGVSIEALTPHLYVHYEDRAVQHLFEVATGLDSMVVGEAQVLGQVRTALRQAQDVGAAGRVLNELVQQAIRVGKRAHSETGIDRAGQSLVTVGLDRAAEVLGDLAGRPALVVGAGSMAALAATTLRRRGLGEVVVLNRTPEHARRVAASVQGHGGGLDELGDRLAAADVVISCTGAVGTVIPVGAVLGARSSRDGAPQVLLDLALPRDVDSGVRDVAGVELVDLELLAQLVSRGGHAHDVDEVRGIVAEEVRAFLGWQRAASVAPTVVALRSMADAVVDTELARLTARVPELDERARAEVVQAVRRVVDKLLHAPTVRVKELAVEPGGHAYADALRALFDLDPEAVDVVTRAGLVEPAPDVPETSVAALLAADPTGGRP